MEIEYSQTNFQTILRILGMRMIEMVLIGVIALLCSTNDWGLESDEEFDKGMEAITDSIQKDKRERELWNY